jgi:hypothetical protein
MVGGGLDCIRGAISLLKSAGTVSASPHPHALWEPGEKPTATVRYYVAGIKMINVP